MTRAEVRSARRRDLVEALEAEAERQQDGGANPFWRPRPPAELLDAAAEPCFVPAPELVDWARSSFVAEGAPLHSRDHEHLADAEIGGLWTNVPHRRKMREVLATAEVPMPPPASGAWARGRWEQQLREWFGAVPDFIVTVSTAAASELDDASWCALVEHELYHCAQALDSFGAPRFNRTTGRPVYAIKGHDVEEFVGVVRRYGIGAAAAGVAELVAAAAGRAGVAQATIRMACGTCLRRAG